MKTQCRHFNGTINETCRAHVNYRSIVGGPDFGWAARLPCIPDSPLRKEPMAKCEAMDMLTPNELMARELELKARMEKRIEAMTLARADGKDAGEIECPQCEKRLRYWAQVRDRGMLAMDAIDLKAIKSRLENHLGEPAWKCREDIRQLLAEVERLQTALDHPTSERMGHLIRERDSLKAECERLQYENTLGNIQLGIKLRDERDELRAEVERLRAEIDQHERVDYWIQRCKESEKERDELKDKVERLKGQLEEKVSMDVLCVAESYRQEIDSYRRECEALRMATRATREASQYQFYLEKADLIRSEREGK